MSRVRLGDIVSRVKDFENKDNTDLLYYVGGEHFDNRSLTVNRKGIIKGSTIGPAFHTKFTSGDVLLMSRNPHLRKAGMVDFDGICSDVSYIIRTKDEKIIKQKFIPLLFQSDILWNFAERNKKGSTNFFLNWSDFEKFEFDLPNIDEQEKLCAVLWAIDDTLKSYQQQIKQCDELVKGQFVEMFGECKKVNLSDVSEIVMGQSPDSKSYNEESNGMPFFQGKIDFGDKYTTVTKWTTKPNKIVPKNTVLMSVRAPVGPVNIASVECCLGRGLCGIIANKDITNNNFIYNALKLQEQQIAEMGTGSTFNAITKNNVYNIKLPYASIKEYNQFSSFAEHLDKSKFDIKEAMKNAQKIFDGILKEKIK